MRGVENQKRRSFSNTNNYTAMKYIIRRLSDNSEKEINPSWRDVELFCDGSDIYLAAIKADYLFFKQNSLSSQIKILDGYDYKNGMSKRGYWEFVFFKLKEEFESFTLQIISKGTISGKKCDSASIYGYKHKIDKNEKHEVPLIWLAALTYLADELEIASFNEDNKSDLRPFENTAQKYKCPAFEVEAYNWDDDSEQEYNFKWRDVKIKWYKYLGRGMEANKQLTVEEAALMLEECILSLKKDFNNE